MTTPDTCPRCGSPYKERWGGGDRFQCGSYIRLFDRRFRDIEGCVRRQYSGYCLRCGTIRGHDEYCAMAEVEGLLGIETSCEDDATCAVIKAGSGSASRELLVREASARAAVSEFLRGVGK